VTLMSWWPRSLCTTGSGIPLLSASVAKVCLSTCGLTFLGSSPALLARVLRRL